MRLYHYLYLLIFFLGCGEKERQFFAGKDAEDIFIVKSELLKVPTAVDIVWVVDNSYSMKEEQTDLANNFSSFIRHFINRNVDFKMVIITTDSVFNHDTEGKLNSAYAKSNKTDFISYFSSKIQVGIHGSHDEKGLGFSKAFLKNNPSWPRRGARLILFYVSDENDSSPNPVDHYVQYVQDIKSETHLVKIFSLVTTDVNAGVYYGKKYIEASNATSGFVGDIRGSFNNIMDNFGKVISKTSSTIFPLKRFPANLINLDEDMEIYINGELFRLEQGKREYLKDVNSLKFFSGHAPQAGDEIRVVYTAKSLRETQ